MDQITRTMGPVAKADFFSNLFQERLAHLLTQATTRGPSSSTPKPTSSAFFLPKRSAVDLIANGLCLYFGQATLAELLFGLSRSRPSGKERSIPGKMLDALRSLFFYWVQHHLLDFLRRYLRKKRRTGDKRNRKLARLGLVLLDLLQKTNWIMKLG